MYFLLEYIQGGDLFDLIEKQGIMNDNQARFYIACFILALEYLHGKGICYRDLKPENSVIDDKGYLRLVDLGAAKFLNEESGNRTFTIIGSPHYMAPEIVEGKGYSFACDRWSLGVCLFEMICGQFPYGSDGEDPYEIFSEIVESKRLEFPMIYENKIGQGFMSKLLEKNWKVRGREKWSELKRDNFFNGFNWEELLNMELASPFEPNLCKKDELDLQNQIPQNTNLNDYLQVQNSKIKRPLTTKGKALDELLDN